MSADNVIIILETPGENGKEYRVAEVGDSQWYLCPCSYCHQEFESAHFFDDERKAEKYASEYEKNLGFVEYGIEYCRLTIPFNELEGKGQQPLQDFKE